MVRTVPTFVTLLPTNQNEGLREPSLTWVGPRPRPPTVGETKRRGVRRPPRSTVSLPTPTCVSPSALSQQVGCGWGGRVASGCRDRSQRPAPEERGECPDALTDLAPHLIPRSYRRGCGRTVPPHSTRDDRAPTPATSVTSSAESVPRSPERDRRRL